VITLPEPSINVTPLAEGVTEQQADERARATRAVSVASNQADRLKLMEATASGAYREDIDAARGNLQDKRKRVLQALQELEMTPPERSAGIRELLDRDVDALLDALRGSYTLAPAPVEGVPEPSPLPPPVIR
jgi:hypothetical protein